MKERDGSKESHCEESRKVVTLTLKERLHFLEYCKQESEASKVIVEQLEKISAPPALVGMERSKSKAFAVVALTLSSQREEFNVSGEDLGELSQE